MDQNTGKYIIIFGLIAIVIGIMIYFFHDKFPWIGRLPGDIRVENGNTRFYFPIVTMVVFSLLITLIVNIIRRLL